ncbi:MAG: hypothetical protein EOM40_09490 [Clostridia bacterium]|nr:hypothetical protein [Clostridia bacterium]NCC42392.1 hypothetical protein [Clostridia bacterium]
MNTRTPIYVSPNMLRVCIDHQDAFNIAGRFYSPLASAEYVFRDSHELLLKADQLFDQVGYPQAFQHKRSFTEHAEPNNTTYCTSPKTYMDAAQIYAKCGDIATYNIIVLSRAKTNWQGRINDAEDHLIGSFVDALEVLRFICRQSTCG